MQEIKVPWTMYFMRCWRKNIDNSSDTETDEEKGPESPSKDKDPESPCRSSKRQAANIEETEKLKRRSNRTKMGKIPNQVTILIQRILQIRKKRKI